MLVTMRISLVLMQVLLPHFLWYLGVCTKNGTGLEPRKVYRYRPANVGRSVRCLRCVFSRSRRSVKQAHYSIALDHCRSSGARSSDESFLNDYHSSPYTKGVGAQS